MCLLHKSLYPPQVIRPVLVPSDPSPRAAARGAVEAVPVPRREHTTVPQPGKVQIND